MKRKSDLILVFTLLFVTVVFGTLIFFKKSESYSQSENRILADFPKLNVKSVLNGDFSKGVSNFYKDRFVGRELFTTIKGCSECLLLRMENNGVVFGKDKYLLSKPDEKNPRLFKENLKTLKDFCGEQKNEGREVIIYFAPRSTDVLKSKLPLNYPWSSNEKAWREAKEELPHLIESNEEICKLNNGMYKTDHHFTPCGAYEAYKKIAKEMNVPPVKLELFEKQTLSKDYCGSTFSKLGMNALQKKYSEDFYIFESECDSEFTCVNYDSEEVHTGFYFKENAQKKDKYKTFLGGNKGHMGIYRDEKLTDKRSDFKTDTKNLNNREKIFVVKDSFANSVAPFLSFNFDVEMYDLRYFKGSIGKEIERENPKKILIIYGMETVFTDGSLKLLKY